jgi:hypothetical protein
MVQINSSLLTIPLYSSVIMTQNIQSLSWRYNPVRLYIYCNCNCFLAFTFSVVTYCTTSVSIPGLRIDISTQQLLNTKHEYNTDYQIKLIWISPSKWAVKQRQIHNTTKSYNPEFLRAVDYPYRRLLLKTNVWCGKWLCFRVISHTGQLLR